MKWKKNSLICDIEGDRYFGKNGEDYEFVLNIKSLSMFFVVHPVPIGHRDVKDNPSLFGKWTAFFKYLSENTVRRLNAGFEFGYYENEEVAKQEVEKVVKRLLKELSEEISKLL